MDAKFDIFIGSKKNGCECEISEVSVESKKRECAFEVDMTSVNHDTWCCNVNLECENMVHDVTKSDGFAAEVNARAGTENESARRMLGAHKAYFGLSRPPPWNFRNPSPCIEISVVVI